MQMATVYHAEKTHPAVGPNPGSHEEVLDELWATRKLSCNRVLEVIEANRRGTWTINAL